MTTYGFAREVSISNIQSSNMFHVNYIKITETQSDKIKKCVTSFQHSQEIIYNTCKKHSMVYTQK